jgi:glycosyltransferase involved in cell wall biosynthesis
MIPEATAKEISVIFPGYNEEENIGPTIRRSLEALRPLFERFEIIIVDDASKDRTGAMADALAAEHPEIRVIHNPVNVGQGESILIGFREARYDLVLHNAMDYPFDLRDLDKMLAVLDDADIIVAVRTRRAGYTMFRRFVSVSNITLLHLLFGLKLRDFNFVQLYRKSVLQSIPVQTRSTGFVTPELLIRANDMGYRIREVVCGYLPREKGVATVTTKVLRRSLQDVLTFWAQRRRAQALGRRRAPQPEPRGS